MVEARVAGAEVVDCEPDPELVELADRRPSVIDVIDEMHRWTETDAGNVKADGFMLLASKLPDSSDPRDLGNAFYEFLTSADATALEPARLRRLKQRMLKFVSEHGLDDLRRLISQTMD